MAMRSKQIKIFLVLFITAFAALYLNNASSLHPIARAKGLRIIAHRGLAQLYSRENLDASTCTAKRLLPTPHSHIENTLPSMQAAFDLGASAVELDLHPTKDGKFAVFHDWTLDCRSDGRGPTRQKTLDELQQLDIGYGYSFDQGQTFPFRGKKLGPMPSLAQVLERFPDSAFVLDVKGNTQEEGERLATVLQALPEARQAQLMVYGGEVPVQVVQSRVPRTKTIWRKRLKRCLAKYMATGWSGYVPNECRKAMLLIPINIAPWLWGWPNRFLQRMSGQGSDVFLLGAWSGQPYSTPLNSPEHLSELPDTELLGIWTDRADAWASKIQAARNKKPRVR